jgi:hypothetical protein
MKNRPYIAMPAKITRLGLLDVDDQVRQAIANVTLEGLQPSEQAVLLERAVASGAISTEEALNKLRSMYAVCP